MSTLTPHDRLEQHYGELERKYRVFEDFEYGTLVTANGNDRVPIHRWFKMKEAYSNRLLNHVFRATDLHSQRELRVFDPFSGSGTTAVSAGDMVRERVLKSSTVSAFEVNPFLHLLSSAKVAGQSSSHRDVMGVAGGLARRAMSANDGMAVTPLLSTFSNESYFPQANLNRLLALSASITAASKQLDDELVSFLRVALAASIEPSSNLRRDGRALRLAPGKAVQEPLDVFLGIADRIADDVDRRRIEFSGQVHLADVRDPGEVLHGTDDLSVFSPPYPNNIDYTEVYKMEGWLLGLYGSAADVANQRRRTLRSHSSLRWGSKYLYKSRPDADQIDSMLKPLLDAIPDDRYRRGRDEVVRGYIDDMLAAIAVVGKRLRRGGEMAIVVGNSMHGKQPGDYVIASDLLLARLAELEGFAVRSITVGRYPRRRVSRSRFLRESVVLARKE